MNDELATMVIGKAIAGDFTLATAESCTGGLIAAALTDVPGSSTAFDRGFVTYSNEAKVEMLGVSMADIKTHGAVSSQVAAAMVHGALQLSNASVSCAVTGIAGPGGGSPAKPVGLVYVGVGQKGQPPLVRECRFDELGLSSRSDIREATVRTALQMLIEVLDG